MTPSEELEKRQKEQEREFKKEQREKIKAYREQAREREKAYSKRMYGLGNWRNHKKPSVDAKKSFRAENEKLMQQLKNHKRKKVQIEGKSIIEILHSVEK